MKIGGPLIIAWASGYGPTQQVALQFSNFGDKNLTFLKGVWFFFIECLSMVSYEASQVDVRVNIKWGLQYKKYSKNNNKRFGLAVLFLFYFQKHRLCYWNGQIKSTS